MRRAELAGSHQTDLAYFWGMSPPASFPWKRGRCADGDPRTPACSPREVGCSHERRCRCLGRCFRWRRHPCPCTSSPFRPRAPNPQFNALWPWACPASRPAAEGVGGFRDALPPRRTRRGGHRPRIGASTRHALDRLIASHARGLRGLRGERRLRPCRRA